MVKTREKLRRLGIIGSGIGSQPYLKIEQAQPVEPIESNNSLVRTETNLAWPRVKYDTENGMSEGGRSYTVPENGLYSLDTRIRFFNVKQGRHILRLIVSGISLEESVESKHIQLENFSDIVVTLSTTIPLNQGDTIEWEISVPGSVTGLQVPGRSVFTLVRLGSRPEG